MSGEEGASVTQYEVESKFPVSDFEEVRRAIFELGARGLGKVHHEDTYYQHPSRDFGETKEALRVRRVDGKPLVTYKGPKLSLANNGPDDAPSVKARVELEWPLDPGDSDGGKMERLLTLLGFTAVGRVAKQRESFELQWNQRETTITLDHVKQLGDYVEIEQLVAEDEVGSARDEIQTLAKRMGLQEVEPLSYLTLAMRARADFESDSGH